MKNQLLYKDLAKYYDLIYSWKDYKKEIEKLNTLINKYKKSKGKDLLEVACGTGHHLEYLKNYFTCTGIDINQNMLNIAKKKLKNITFKKANMINFNLKKKFDIITCMFSSIGYVKTYKSLEKTIKNFSDHLKQGGVVIIEPWFSTPISGTPHMTTYEDKNIKIARLGITKIKNSLSTLEMEYLIAERNKDIKHFKEIHELGMFTIDKTKDIMKKANLKVYYLKNKNRGLFIGVKQ